MNNVYFVYTFTNPGFRDNNGTLGVKIGKVNTYGIGPEPIEG